MSSNLLDEKYKKYIINKIPILNNIINNNETLLDIIIDYCTLKSTKFQYKDDVIIILKKINNELKNYVNMNNNINLNLNSKRYNSNTNKKNNKFLKIQNINALNLIEAIISFTYDYYIKDENKNEKIYENFLINNKKMIIKMINLKNKNAISLDDFIKDLYNSDCNDITKNQKLLNILIEVSKKLNHLQEKYGLIHGDLHSLNIFLIPLNNIYFIQLIDFGLSSIILPTKDINNKIILEMPVYINIERSNRLNIFKDDRLKCIDLFRLIQYLYSRIFNNIKIKCIDEYSNFIKKLYNMTNFNEKIEKSHEYSKTKNFINQINNDSILYPENFMKLNINNIYQTPIKSKKKLSPFYNSHNLIKSTQKLSLIKTPPKKLIFENENNKEYLTPPKRLSFENNNNGYSTPKKQKKNYIFSTP